MKRRTFLSASAATAIGAGGALGAAGSAEAAAPAAQNRPGTGSGPAPAHSAKAPDFGPNVTIFDPSTPAADIQKAVDAVFAAQESNQFGTERVALLFKPGSYQLDINVGFYTQVLGLGLTPDQTHITGGVTVDAQWLGGNATQNFWRGAENLKITPSSGTEIWAVSQASPIRRVHVDGDLKLDPTGDGWSSGGFLSDGVVTGQVSSGSQQQWLTRNATYGSWVGNNWNMVFMGVQGAPAAHFPQPSYTVLDSTPVVREKPFLYIDDAGAYHVFVPALRRDSSGTTWLNATAKGRSLPISDFYVAKPGDSARTINAALRGGKHLLLTPGYYSVDQAIEVTNPGTVVLGIGLASLRPTRGNAAITVADVDGVTVAGVLVDAGPVNSPVLVEIGQPGSRRSHAADPTFVFDLFARIGGAGPGLATSSLVVNSSDVVLDDLWLWRADHGDGVGWTTNPAAHGLVVNGDRVTAYGLAAEHYQKENVLWNGEHGRTVFFQNELPYDVPDQASWQRHGVPGYPAYKVADDVSSHEGWGLGAYCFFNVGPAIQAENGFEAPDVPGVDFHNLLTVFLSGNGQINHVINEIGGPSVNGAGVYYLTEFIGGHNPILPKPLDRSAWVPTAFSSDGYEPITNMIDGHNDTRWSSGTTMADAGQWVQIDMGETQRINLISVDCGGNDTDFPRSYRLELSTDGSTWRQVAAGDNDDALLIVPFAAQNARYIKLTQTGTSSSWWSITEFNAYLGRVTYGGRGHAPVRGHGRR